MKSFEQLLPMAVSALALCGLGVAAEVAAAEENPPLVSPADRADMGKEALPPQASISFPDRNIDDWRANGRKGLWIRAQRKWYYAELFMPCDELPWAQSIGFGTGGAVTFDRHSFIVVRGQRYPLRSLTASAPPPVPERKKPPAKPTSPR